MSGAPCGRTVILLPWQDPQGLPGRSHRASPEPGVHVLRHKLPPYQNTSSHTRMAQQGLRALGTQPCSYNSCRWLGDYHSPVHPLLLSIHSSTSSRTKQAGLEPVSGASMSKHDAVSLDQRTGDMGVCLALCVFLIHSQRRASVSFGLPEI